MNAEKITGVILAGGKNSRMGTDKGLLVVRGKKIIDRILDTLKPNVNDIIIISNGNNYSNLGYKVYADIIKDCGPLGGIHTALTFSRTKKNLVISCDMPFLNEKILKFIIADSDDCDVALPVHDNRTEPLCAVYDSICTDKFSELLSKNQLKMQDALKEFKVKKININKTDFDSNCFTNINTKEELVKINSDTT